MSSAARWVVTAGAQELGGIAREHRQLCHGGDLSEDQVLNILKKNLSTAVRRGVGNFYGC